MKRCAPVLAFVLMCAVGPAFAGSVGVYGTYWDGGDADPAYGAGARVGFDFLNWLELEFHGTWYQDLEDDAATQPIQVTATPIDGGLKFNLLPESKFNVYVGGGVTYYLVDSNFGDADNETSYYGEAGIEFGGEHAKLFVEALWRDLDVTIEDTLGDSDADFSGVAGNVGLNWRW